MKTSMAQLSEWYGRLLEALVFAACLLLLLMTVMIGADVVSRNIGGGGVAISNEISMCLFISGRSFSKAARGGLRRVSKS